MRAKVHFGFGSKKWHAKKTLKGPVSQNSLTAPVTAGLGNDMGATLERPSPADILDVHDAVLMCHSICKF